MIGEKKFLSLLVVLVLVIGGFFVISGHTEAEEGELVSEVEFNVVLDVEDGVSSVYECDTHMFMHGVDGVRYNELDEEWRVELDTWEALMSYNNLFFNPAHEGKNTTAMQEAIDAGWIDEPEEVRWLANNTYGEWTVNPFAHNDIRFAMQYLNREAMIEELLDGLAYPRYGYMESSLEVWEEHFVKAIQEEFDIGPEGDEDYMAEWIEKGMEDIQENVAFGEVRFDEGYWQYRAPGEDWHTIEVIILPRIEDWRLDLGKYIADILEDCGFDVYVSQIIDSPIPRVFFGDPEPFDNLDYHIYTGGWISAETEYYQHEALSRMYAPWYGFLQIYGPEEHWQYDDEGYDKEIAAHEDGRGYATGQTVEDMDNAAQDLYYGDVEDEDDYWEKKVETTQLGFMESLRVFLVTTQEFYPYNPNKILSAVTESINGYDTYFGPRTMITDDGTLDTEIMTGVDKPYFDNWNYYGGSNDIYGEYQRRMLREYGTWNHPRTGIPMQVNNYWMDNDQLEEERPERTHPYDIQGGIEIDEEGIDIPDDAVDYFPAEREWKEVSEYIEEENRTAPVKATIDVHEEHVWHDGTDLNLQDVMAAYARDKELGDDTHEPYLESWEAQKAGWWNSISAIEWNEDEGTYTIYGDYSFPIEDLIGDHYSMFPEVHPLTYEGWNHLHGGEETEYGGIVEEDYLYEPESGYNWIHQISSEHNEDLVTVLETMRQDEWIPYYLREENNAPISMDEDELTTQLDSVIDFIDTYEHSYISAGPFMLEDYDEDDGTMDMTRWDDYGFPFEGEEAEGEEFTHGYWRAQFELPYLEVDITEYDEDVRKGEEVSVQYEVENTGTGQDTQDIVFRVDGDEHDVYEDLTLDPQDYHQGEFVWDGTEEPGTYEIEVASEDTSDTGQVNVEEVLELTIDIEGEGTVEVDGEEVEDGWTQKYEEGTELTITAEPDEGWEFIGWTGTDETGEEITITMDEDKEITAVFEEEEEEEVEETPGFTSMMFLLSIVIAVVIYKKHN